MTISNNEEINPEVLSMLESMVEKKSNKNSVVTENKENAKPKTTINLNDNDFGKY
ncbi:hypothetical protein H0486_10345 [Lachnospiraceae bacterium MD1]|uniref:Uncharacterized protein n=1 Tax=Variimorphobacter saccharofermentans TaxID=2755051 RepID=A0A839K2Q6_9FIRM|nr:hypothetical protein [Variimorphobacter saccharofermentans]